jgi:putative ABC transport system ATP-binding protein
MARNAKTEYNGALIELVKVCKTYFMGIHKVDALKDVDLKINGGEMVAVMGPSGSGKSTLMNILGCLDKPTSGKYLLEGKNVATFDDNQFAKIRNSMAGFVFQNFNLLARTSAVENVALPLLYSGTRGNVKERAMAALEMVGLTDWWHHKPSELSGGQQQRVAIARAIVSDPEVIFADEPTGNLDTKSGDEILDIFTDLHKQGKAIIIVTHDPDISKRCPRKLMFRDGFLVSDETK